MKKLRITIEGKSYEVLVERLDEAGESAGPPQTGAIPAAAPQMAAPVKRAAPAPRPSLSSGAITSPMAGVILSMSVVKGEDVEQDQVLLILEAMKMENQIIAPAPAKVKDIHVKSGDSVTEGQLLVELE